MTSKVLDDIIAKIVPEEVPAAYIVMAKLTDFQGVEHIFRGDELAHVLKYPELYQIADARIVLNVRKIKNDILNETRLVFEAVERRLSAKSIEHTQVKRIPPPDNN